MLDPALGSVRLTGWLRARPYSDTLAVIIHGLGGSADSRYMLRTAKAAHDAGLSYLRLNMRGADRSGEDLYHAGLTQDLRAVLASPDLAPYSRVFVIGYSLGGHVALRWASEPGRDPRVCAVAAVCAPLDLAYGARTIQRPLGRPYQWYCMRGLKAMYRAAAARRPVPVPVEHVMAMGTVLEWDRAIVAPRFGFASREAPTTKRPARARGSARSSCRRSSSRRELDPMVTADQIRPWLEIASPAVEVAWTERGGHGLPRRSRSGARRRRAARAPDHALARSLLTTARSARRAWGRRGGSRASSPVSRRRSGCGRAIGRRDRCPRWPPHWQSMNIGATGRVS
ncbi:MAG: alpha/beta fold hydrolase [Sandaracinaceae bacterium]|nr:alpha/beta fold hydrolase [Sandaracinaceae bacterium]